MTIDYDSIMTHPVPSPLQVTAQYVCGQQLPNTYMDTLRTPSQSTDPWVLATLILLLAVLLAVFAGNLSYLAYRIKDFFASERKFSNLPQQTTTGELLTVIVPILVGSLSLSIIAYTPLEATANSLLPAPGLLYPLVAAAVLAWILLKAALYSLVNWVFFDHNSRRKWTSSYFLLTACCLLPAYPAAVVMLYTDLPRTQIANCLLATLILYETLLFLKLNTNFQTKMYGKLLIFLYFCTAEILPAILVGHFAQVNVAW